MSQQRQQTRTQDFRAPRRPEVLDHRAKSKRTKLQFHCACGATVFEIVHHAMMAAPATGKLLARQGHRKHQAETGCGLEIV